MIAKMSIIWPLLLLAGSLTFSNSSPTDKPVSKTFLELHDEALQACSINSTRDLIKAFKNIKEEIVEDVCSVSCYAQSLGIVNDRGLNKLALSWILGNSEYNWRSIPFYSNDSPSTIRERAQKDVDDMQNSTHYAVYLLNDACSTKNQTAMNLIFSMNISQSVPDNVIPSEENSPILELILNTADTCSTKFNVTSFEIVYNLQSHVIIGNPTPLKKTVCYVHCMLSELDIVSETSLNEPWAGTVRDMVNNETLEMVNAAATLLKSKCSTEYNELADNYFATVFAESFQH